MTEKIKILFVDDNPDITNLAAAIAAQMPNVETIVCNNGADAVKLTAKNRFDAVVLDLSMPAMDGLTVAEEIRRNESAQIVNAPPTNLVFYTAATVNPAVHRAVIQFDVRRVYGKPFDISSIFEEIKGWITQ